MAYLPTSEVSPSLVYFLIKLTHSSHSGGALAAWIKNRLDHSEELSARTSVSFLAVPSEAAVCLGLGPWCGRYPGEQWGPALLVKLVVLIHSSHSPGFCELNPFDGCVV